MNIRGSSGEASGGNEEYDWKLEKRQFLLKNKIKNLADLCSVLG